MNMFWLMDGQKQMKRSGIDEECTNEDDDNDEVQIFHEKKQKDQRRGVRFRSQFSLYWKNMPKKLCILAFVSYIYHQRPST